jgi:hypothetical protein
MKKRLMHTEFIPLADMHTDGVRFDPVALLAWKKEQGFFQGDSKHHQNS